MRMRTNRGLASATFLIFGVGSASNAFAQLQLRGSDTLEDVTRDAVAAAGLGSVITYVGGGSGAGESAMVGGTQHISPMSRELNSGAADATRCTATAQQLLVGLDGIAVVAANRTGGDSLDATASTTDNCSDSISGGSTLSGILRADGVTPCDAATDGCTVPGSYTFASWRDVLAMVYGGQNHNTAGALNTAAGAVCTYVAPPNEATADTPCLPAGQVCFPNNRCGDPALVGRRNPSRINCLSPVRQALVNTYGNLFSDVSPTSSCRTGTCVRLRHAFRRDDLSGTTDTFVGLVGLPTIANPTRAFANNSPMPDRAAVANPFCNAGGRPMNKGDSDYLDLDPVRRAIDHEIVSGNRFGLEQIGQLVPAFGGNNNDANCMRGGIPDDRASSTQPGVWPDPNIANSQALLQADLGFDAVNGGLLPVPYAPTTRLCLGLVLPITLPATFNTPQVAYFADASNTPVPCDILDPPGVGPGRAIDSVNMDTQHTGTALCPNGTRQPCDLPYHVDPSAPNGRNFNCYQNQLNPNLSGVQDMRVFNLHPVDVTGHYVRDNYLNSSIPGLAALRQARVPTAFYRLHTTRNTTLNGSVPTAASCRTLSATDQIGCLVKASACSIGYAGREAVDNIMAGPAADFALRIEGITGSTQNIQNLVIAGSSPVYPISRKLWMNSIVGFSAPAVTADELALFSFESSPANIDPIILNRNFVQVPSTVSRLRACPSGL